MLKSLMIGPPLLRCSSSATNTWGDWFDTTDSPFPFSGLVLGPRPTDYYSRFYLSLRIGIAAKRRINYKGRNSPLYLLCLFAAEFSWRFSLESSPDAASTSARAS